MASLLQTDPLVGVGNVIQGMDLVYLKTKSPNPFRAIYRTLRNYPIKFLIFIRNPFSN